MSKKARLQLIRKEIVEELRSIKSIAWICLLNIMLLVCVATMFYSAMSATTNGYTTNYKAVLYIYNNLIFIEFIAVLIIVPIIAGCSYAKELESGTLDLLMLTQIRTPDLVLAKMIRIVGFSLCLVITSLPLICVVFSVGGVNASDLLMYVAIVLVTTLLYGSIGMYFSVKHQHSFKAVIYTYIVELVSTIGVQFALKLIYIIADRIKNMAFYTGQSGAEYKSFQFKNLGIFLIGNPLYDIFKLQSDIVGNTSSYDVAMNDYGVNPVIRKLWIFIGVIIYIFISLKFIKKIKVILNYRHGK